MRIYVVLCNIAMSAFASLHSPLLYVAVAIDDESQRTVAPRRLVTAINTEADMGHQKDRSSKQATRKLAKI